MAIDTAPFSSQKSIGEAAENRVGQYFASKGFHCHKALGQHADYDLFLSASIEIKADSKAAQTGNVAIEIGCSGRPSGLNATTADFWAFVVGHESWLILTATLRRLVEHRPIRTANGGHNEIVLLPIIELKKHAKKLG